MSSPSFKVVPATVEDAMDLATVAYETHQCNPLFAPVLHKSPVTKEEQVEFYARSFRKGLERLETEKGKALGLHTLKAVVLDGQGKETVVGIASWMIPTSGEEMGEKAGEGEEKKETDGAEIPNWPAGIQATRFVRDLRLRGEPFKEKFVGKNGAELGSLTVHPEYQRKGVGKLFMNWGLAKADAAGLRIFLQSTEEGRRLYEQCGFRAIAEFAMDMSEYGGTGLLKQTCMLREVHAADIGPLFS